MNTQVKALASSPRINTSLILFVKMAAFPAAVSRDLAADVVISGVRIECGVMRNIMIFAAIIAGLGTLMAQMADRMAPALAHSASPKAAVAATVAQAGSRSISIPRDSRGHF